MHMETPCCLISVWSKYLHRSGILSRVRPRFFVQVGHETIYASSGNKHFFTKSCHHQTYQNYEQPPQRYQNTNFQSQFLMLKISLSIFSIYKYWTMRQTLINI